MILGANKANVGEIGAESVTHEDAIVPDEISLLTSLCEFKIFSIFVFS